MGVLNVTPDSFSDGGKWLDPEAAISHGKEMIAEGAAIVDVGGESTRPGADPVSEAEEMKRVIPVVRELSTLTRVSIDTRKADVAEAAVEAGATLVNDVSASLFEVAARNRVGWVAMHMKGDPGTMQLDPTYDDVVEEVRGYLIEKAEKAAAAGVEEIWIDPGIGFGKTVTHNLELLKSLRKLVTTGYPVVVGTSRKSFLGKILHIEDASDRLEGSIATAVWAVAQGARMIRAHDVAATVRAVNVVGDIGGRSS